MVEKRRNRPFFWLRRREDIAREIDEELRLHIELTVEELIEEGMEPSSARREAEKRFGDYEARRRECTEFGVHQLRLERRIELMSEIIHDIRFAIRSFHRTPAFSLIVIITLAMGIGASTLVFSVVDGVLLRPLPYKDSQRLVMVGEMFTDRGRRGPGQDASQLGPASPLNFFDWRDRSTCFEALVAQIPVTLNLSGRGIPEGLSALGVSADYFSMLRVQPLMGRGLLREDDQPKAEGVVVLSFGLWQRRFGGDADIIGRKLTLSEHPYTVVGVIPPGFHPPMTSSQHSIDAWIPLSFAEVPIDTRRARFLDVAGRLRSDISLAQAREEMKTLGAVLARDYPMENNGAGIRIESLHQQTAGETDRPLKILMGGVMLLLLIACANVASLFVSRAIARQKEMALRSALGASRGRIVRQLLTESISVSILGGALGVGFAYAGVELLAIINPGAIPRIAEVAVDLRVMSFTLALSIATGILFGLAPILQTSKNYPIEALKMGASGATNSKDRRRMHQSLIIVETALAFVLLIGAGLVINSFVRLQRVDLGFVTENILTTELRLGPRYDSREKQTAFFTDLTQRIKNIAGVKSAGMTTSLPLSGNLILARVSFEGQAPDRLLPHIPFCKISPGYFETMGIRLIKGRDFTEMDNPDHEPVIIVNESLARLYWPDKEALGQRLKFGRHDSSSPWMTIIGVVNDIHQRGVGIPGEPESYLPLLSFEQNQTSLAIRYEEDTAPVTAAIRQAVWEIDPDIPVTLNTMKALVSTSITEPRFYTILLGSFAAMALTLACVGIYGMMSYSVAQRAREIGIRRALGARDRRILWMVLRQGLYRALLGLAAGLLISFWAARLLAKFLFGVSTTDPLTFITVAILLAAVGVMSAYIPARRALKVDPLLVLRAE